MSIQSEIDRINGNVASTYTALSEMGATMPETQNSDNLPGTVRTVPTGGGTSVQTDWNQTDETAPDFLKNKPFGDFPTGSDTLTWDGNIDGLFDIAGAYYKVSDSVVTLDDLSNGAAIRVAGVKAEITLEDLYKDGVVLDDGFVNFDFFMLVPYDGYDLTPHGLEGFTCPKGVYSLFSDGLFISEFYIPGYTGFSIIKKIEEKFLPVKTFFVNTLEETLGTAKYYLYTDETFSVKVTKLDSIEAIKSGNAVVRFSKSGELQGMASLLYASLNKDYAEVCIITGVVNGTAISLFLYTAEYTP